MKHNIKEERKGDRNTENERKTSKRQKGKERERKEKRKWNKKGRRNDDDDNNDDKTKRRMKSARKVNTVDNFLYPPTTKNNPPTPPPPPPKKKNPKQIYIYILFKLNMKRNNNLPYLQLLETQTIREPQQITKKTCTLTNLNPQQTKKLVNYFPPHSL